MNTFESETHKAIISDEGILDVFQLEGKKIKEITFDGDRTHTTEHTATEGAPFLRKLLDEMDNLPVFRAAYAGKGVYHVDLETGTQRWKGYKEDKDIISALAKCKFNKKDIRDIMDLCEVQVHAFLTRVG